MHLLSEDAISEASLTPEIATSDPAGELTAPPRPLAGLRARERACNLSSALCHWAAAGTVGVI